MTKSQTCKFIVSILLQMVAFILLDGGLDFSLTSARLEKSIAKYMGFYQNSLNRDLWSIGVKLENFINISDKGFSDIVARGASPEQALHEFRVNVALVSSDSYYIKEENVVTFSFKNARLPELPEDLQGIIVDSLYLKNTGNSIFAKKYGMWTYKAVPLVFTNLTLIVGSSNDFNPLVSIYKRYKYYLAILLLVVGINISYIYLLLKHRSRESDLLKKVAALSQSKENLVQSTKNVQKFLRLALEQFAELRTSACELLNVLKLSKNDSNVCITPIQEMRMIDEIYNLLTESEQLSSNPDEEEVDLSSLVVSIRGVLYTELCSRGVDIYIVPEEAPLILDINQYSLAQVLVTLLYNSLNVSPQGGEIHIKVGYSKEVGARIEIFDGGYFSLMRNGQNAKSNPIVPILSDGQLFKLVQKMGAKISHQFEKGSGNRVLLTLPFKSIQQGDQYVISNQTNNI